MLAGRYKEQPWPGYGYDPEKLREDLKKYENGGKNPFDEIKYVLLFEGKRGILYTSSLHSLAQNLVENFHIQLEDIEIFGLSAEERNELEYFMSERIWKSSGGFRPRSRSWRPWEQ